MEGRVVLGEMGFYTRAPRSASLLAETPTVVHSLSRDAYERLVRDCPEAAVALAVLIIHILAQRLGVANRLIAAYEQ
jgi:SulP family sulfate permease